MSVATVRGAIVFDLDGTLIDSAPDIHAAVNACLAEEGIAPLSFAKVKGFIGRGVPHLIAQVLGHLGRDPAGPDHARMMRRFLALYEAAVNKTVLYPGVRAALAALRAAGHPLGICTNKPLAPTRAVLDHLDLSEFFGTVIGGDSLALRKPDPAPLHAAFAALGVAPLLFVGDSEVDAATARASGHAFALFTEGYRKTAVEEIPATFAFDDFARLAPWVATLPGPAR